MIGQLKDMTRSRDGKWIVSFVTPEDFSKQFDELADKTVSIEIKQARAKRSLDANGYAWALIDKLAEKLNKKKTEVYLEEIKEIGGITGCVAVKDEFVPAYIDAWKENHIGRDAWLLPGKGKPGWSVVKVRLGSSDFDTAQMARFLDLIIQDCEQQGIATIRDEADKLVGRWKK